MPAVLNLEIPAERYPGQHLGHYNRSDFLGDEHPNRPDMVIESPFFCSASADFSYVRKSPYCTPRTLKLVKMFRAYYLLLEAETEVAPGSEKESLLAQRVALRHEILQCPSIHRPTATAFDLRMQDKDNICECIRLTCLSLIHLSDICISGRTAFNQSTPAIPIPIGPDKIIPQSITNPLPTSLPTALARAFRHAPSSIHGWGRHMEGLLYWIGTVGTAISRGRPEFALFSSVNAKQIWDMGFIEDGRSWDEVIRPLWTFNRFQGMCLNGEIEPLMWIMRESAGGVTPGSDDDLGVAQI
jgi:hypothetical protein